MPALVVLNEPCQFFFLCNIHMKIIKVIYTVTGAVSNVSGTIFSCPCVKVWAKHPDLTFCCGSFQRQSFAFE